MDDRELAKRFNKKTKDKAPESGINKFLIGLVVMIAGLFILAWMNSDRIKSLNKGIPIPRMSRYGNH